MRHVSDQGTRGTWLFPEVACASSNTQSTANPHSSRNCSLYNSAWHGGVTDIVLSEGLRIVVPVPRTLIKRPEQPPREKDLA